FLPISFIILLLGVLRSWLSYRSIGGLQEGDIILILGAVLIGIMGLLADLIVAQGRSRID
ncbi:MAG: hypothetical protein ACP5I1_21530, partial [Candidatus Hinthialibacter sp.]